MSVLSYMFRWNSNLIDKIKDHVILQREIDRTRCQLVDEHLDFNLYDAWDALDKYRKGFLTPLDLAECLEDVNTLGMPQYAKESSVNIFLSVYGKTQSNCRFRFADFTEAVGPILNPYLLKILTSRKASGFFFRGESLILYRRLWKLLFDNIELVNELHDIIRNIIAQATT